MLRRILVVVSFGALAACAAVIGVDGLEIGDCKGGDCLPDRVDDDGGEPVPEPEAGPADGGVDALSAPCDAGGRDAGPRLVRVGLPDNTFCIDSTEVTYGQYREFVEAGVDAAAQGPACLWNTSFVPAVDGKDDRPVANVDWCDAVAYCQWAGKYLCGKAEGSKKVGPVTADGVTDYGTHQWMLACSAQTNKYPYGNTHDASACNTAELDAGGPLPVGSMPTCEGSYPGVFDLVGNVWEWYDGPCIADAGADAASDAASSPRTDECLVKGGGYNRAGPQLDCRVDGLGSTREARQPFVGFRCCSD